MNDKSNLRKRLEDGHKRAARVTGAIALALEKGRINPAIIKEWATELRKAAKEIENG